MSRICKATDAINHDDYGELIGWWTAGAKEIKGSDGPLSLVLRAGTSSHNERLDIRGSAKTMLASASSLFGLGGQIVGAVIVIKDTSESGRSSSSSSTA